MNASSRAADGRKTIRGGQLRVRMRDGLSVAEAWTRRGRIWILSDPMVRDYYYLLDEEYELLRMLGAAESMEAVRERFESAAPHRRLDLGRLRVLIARWHREGLVESRTAGQAEVLLQRRDQVRRRRRWQAWQNPLVIQLPGLDPSGVLPRIEPWFRWLFSWPAVVGYWVLVATAVLMTLMWFDEGLRRLPSLESLATPQTLLVLWLTMGVLKVIHELGHAIACEHFGAKTKEMGVLLMLLMPCLYCDVSDAWRLPRRRDRLIISAAGILIEIGLAALATILWWFTQPGLLNSICLTVMVMGSVNTLLVNGNPLLRYDGYYLLLDAVGIVNLWQRSRQRVAAFFTWLVTGVQRPDELTEDAFSHRFLLLYGLASIAYRWFVLGVMLAFVYALLEPLGLSGIAFVIGMWLIWFTGIVPMWSWGVDTVQLAMQHRRRRQRMVLWCAGAAALVALMFTVPLPNRMSAPAIVRPAEAEDLYVSAPGQLKEVLVPLGATVRRGELIARLSNPQLAIEQLRLQGEIRQAEAWIEHLEARGATTPQSRSALPAARARAADLANQLRQLQVDMQKLDLAAPCAGTVFPVMPVAAAAAEDQLETWSGQALDERNRGAYLATGTRVCTIGPADRWQAFLYVNQNRIDQLAPALPVSLRLEHFPGEVLRGTVVSLAKINAQSIPPQLADEFVEQTNSTGSQTQRPLGSLYQVQVQINAPAPAMLVEARAAAVIGLPRRTAWQLLQTWLAENFSL